jgi:hypothetical protein
MVWVLTGVVGSAAGTYRKKLERFAHKSFDSWNKSTVCKLARLNRAEHTTTRNAHVVIIFYPNRISRNTHTHSRNNFLGKNRLFSMTAALLRASC